EGHSWSSLRDAYNVAILPAQAHVEIFYSVEPVAWRWRGFNRREPSGKTSILRAEWSLIDTHCLNCIDWYRYRKRSRHRIHRLRGIDFHHSLALRHTPHAQLPIQSAHNSRHYRQRLFELLLRKWQCF